MASLTRRLSLLAAVGGCVVLALRPASPVEQAVEAVLAPVRLLSELAWPVGMLRRHSVLAAERHVAELYPRELVDRRELGAEQLRFVLPDEPALRRGRDFVVAEVVRRVARDADRLEVRVLSKGGSAAAGLAPGMPAVVGNVYVGRVSAVTPAGAVVDLVTRSDGFVGGELDDSQGPARMVVGGVRPRRATDERLLAVCSPERAVLEPGEVRVDDGLSGARFADLARGFRLGGLVVVNDQREERTYAVRSPINFAGGIFQLALVRPGDARGGELQALVTDPLEDGRWLAVRALSCGDPLGVREGVVLGAGTLQGVRAGAAVVAGTRLIGRVVRAGPLAAGAGLLGDPGLALPVAASVEGRDEPLALGWLVSLGRPGDGVASDHVLFHWQEGWPADLAADAGQEPVRARLYTGAGAAGVPPWLVIGDAWLARERGPQVLDVQLAVDPRRLAHLRLRLDEEGRP